MKEAAGEANMTVITIVLIAIVLGVGTVIVKNLMSGTSNRSCCAAAGGTYQNGTCKDYNQTEYNSCVNDANGANSTN